MNPILLIVWAVTAVCFLGLLMYRGQLTRYEDDQLFLNEESTQQEHAQQTAIVRKVRMLQPIIRASGGAAGLATASVIGLYVWNAWQHIQ